MNDEKPSGKHPRTILFVCLHGAAKSVLAAADLARLAGRRGVPVEAVAAGLEPDAEMAPAVVAALLADGVDLRAQRPRQVSREDVAWAGQVVAFGCDLGQLADGVPVERWDEVPAVSAGLEAARAAIGARLEDLLDRYEGGERP
jgi:arsenate reductase (thioredoxin)